MHKSNTVCVCVCGCVQEKYYDSGMIDLMSCVCSSTMVILYNHYSVYLHIIMVLQIYRVPHYTSNSIQSLLSFSSYYNGFKTSLTDKVSCVMYTYRSRYFTKKILFFLSVFLISHIDHKQRFFFCKKSFLFFFLSLV